uniref:non-specific serine/threonine protein kinase n=1 Tax=Timema douglasi TaxID=61478 RepID=A0A7R8VT62_TIMDO|nr:unnamed protein product [Timema douglasi]
MKLLWDLKQMFVLEFVSSGISSLSEMILQPVFLLHLVILRQVSQDVKESARQSSHSALREACRSGDTATVKTILAQLGPEAELVINMAPSPVRLITMMLFVCAGPVRLITRMLFVCLYSTCEADHKDVVLSCETGRKDIVKLLLDHGADGRIHTVTRYSPLYIASYNGRKDIVDIILKRYPELIQHYTVERWLPLHACCINGHIHVLELLLKYPYPAQLMHKYRDPSGDWEYEMPFDLNMKDVTGQNVLYVASLLGNYKMVDTLLKFRVKATRIKVEAGSPSESGRSTEELVSPTRRRISDGIQSIMTRLNLSRLGDQAQSSQKNECQLSPLHLNMYCNNNSETALHAAVRGRHNDVASALLMFGADPNLQCRQPEQALLDPEEGIHMARSTALVEACRNRDIGMADLLLRHGARDDDCKALCVVARNRDDILIAKLLSIKAYPDPEYKLNKAAMTEDGVPSMSHLGVASLTYSTLFPNTAVMINWHNQQCDLAQVRTQWLVSCNILLLEKLCHPNLNNHPPKPPVILVWLWPCGVYLNSCKYSGLYLNSCKYSGVYLNTCKYSGVYLNSCKYSGVYLNSCKYSGLQVLRGLFEQLQVLWGLFEQPQVLRVLFEQLQVLRVLFEQLQVLWGLFEQLQLQVLRGLFEQLQVLWGLFEQPQVLRVLFEQLQVLRVLFEQLQVLWGLFEQLQLQVLWGLFEQLQVLLGLFEQLQVLRGLFEQLQVLWGLFEQLQVLWVYFRSCKYCRTGATRVDAALTVNPKLKLNPRNQDIVLFAITRIDLSRNALSWVPSIIFQLHSLRYLNLAQNKMEKLPPAIDRTPAKSPSKKSSLGKTIKPVNAAGKPGYSAPVLEEVYLQDNRLEVVPEELFLLPSLVTLDVSNNKLQELPYVIWRSPKLKELNVAFNLLRELPSNPPEELLSAPGLLTFESKSGGSISDMSDSTEHSSNVDVSEDRNLSLDENLLDARTLQAACFIKSKSVHSQSVLGLHRAVDLTHHNIWSRNVEVTEQILHNDENNQDNCSKLSSLNLAHNQFTSIPVALPCLAVNLTRLNMSYNSLRSMSHITSYPSSLKQVDLSHNQVCCWPSLPQVEGGDSTEHSMTTCYCALEPTGGKVLGKLPLLPGRRSLRSVILNYVCTHRRHLRLDNLRTLILADNKLSRIQLTTDDDGANNTALEEDDSDWDVLNSPSNQNKTRLMFPNLSMLDISNNQLKEIPVNVHELNNLSVLNISGNCGNKISVLNTSNNLPVLNISNNLSVLNISGNCEINELPPQMGLLSRLWNLNTRGCRLQEPLKSMIDSKKYKTMDVIGYLKSVLEDARPYARMKLMIVGVQGIGKTSLLDQLRQEGFGSYKKKPAEHWAKRMGNKNINVKTARGTNMSTVGVDIGDWVYEKKIRGQSSYGPVVFRTWDFGGQREYYATHQYFLSKRSLYLVVWRIPDGQKGINEILQWLVNIQARAPNSPVLIVGTHYDVMSEYKPAANSEDLQQLIRDKYDFIINMTIRFINVVDAEKCGLPRVLDTIEVSCKTRHNIKLLCNLVYDTVFSLRPPGSKELLLEQRVPATYLALEDVVTHISSERRHTGVDPVLNAEQYKAVVSAEMQYRFSRGFRDAAELHQATLFLHENGVLLHYDDATLKDLYFLDPQWLCDMLAHVVTIREINPFARTGVMKLDDLKHVLLTKNRVCSCRCDEAGRSESSLINNEPGVMKLDDLKHVFKSSKIGPIDTRGYIVNLLNKFEVALTWDSRTLLIPSLLPSEETLRSAHTQTVRVKVLPPSLSLFLSLSLST